MAHSKLHAAWFHEPRAIIPGISVYCGALVIIVKPISDDNQEYLGHDRNSSLLFLVHVNVILTIQQRCTSL